MKSLLSEIERSFLKLAEASHLLESQPSEKETRHECT